MWTMWSVAGTSKVYESNMTRRKVISKAVTWLSDELLNEHNLSTSFHYYEKFQFKNIKAGLGDYVLISNADAAEPDTEDGCNAAKIITLYEDKCNSSDPFRAKVQWYSRPKDLPNNIDADSIDFLDNEVLEDHRPFDTDVSIETFFKKCGISITFTKDTDHRNAHLPYNYVCRYRIIALSKRKAYLEPVLEEERKAMQLLRTPCKNATTPKSKTPKTPSSITKRLSRISLTEKNWSISKNDGRKLLLKRAILADKIEKDSPVKITPKTTPKVTNTPKSSKKISSQDIENLLSLESKENSDEELPTLIIRQHIPTTPKRKSSIAKNIDETPKKLLVFDDDKNETCSTRSERVTKNPKNYIEEPISPMKRTPRKLSLESKENSDEELPTLIIRQHIPTTPKRKSSIAKNIDETPKKLLVFDDDKNETCSTRSERVTKNPKNYIEEPISPMKRTPRKLSLESKENSDEELPTLIIRQHIPTTPKRKSSIAKNIDETPKKLLVFDDDKNETCSTRSERVTKNPKNYIEEPISPMKRTPRKLVHKIDIDESEDEFKLIPKTPRTPRTPKTPRTSRVTPSKTPKRNLIKKITGELTPTLRARVHCVENVDEYTKENRSLPGRESQMEEILSFVRTKLLDGSSGCMYISGVPGTGKTATVCTSLKILKEEGDLPDFQLVEVNGMRIAEPRQAYVQIYKQLTGKSVVWQQACALLEKRFTNPGPRRTPTVLLVDELDALCTRRQDVLYSIMEWAAHNSALLTVLAVANTMDLPERALAARVASRLGLTRLTFPSYTHVQLMRIVESRLQSSNVSADAVQIIARKVASVSGDARRALALCSRAIELAGDGSAGLKEVSQALGEAASGAAVRAIKSCSAAERLMLRAVAAEAERTGSDETTLSRALQTAAAIIALDGRPYKCASAIKPPSPSQALAICKRLSAIRLLLVECKPTEPRLLLNVSVDDVHYATRQICV